MQGMVDYAFYVTEYMGDSVPEAEFAAFARDAQAQLNRYKRIYTVTAPEKNSENMALCAMVDALYYFAQAQSGAVGGSVHVGSVSSSAQTMQVDTSPATQEKELYRCARQYLEIYRGPTGGV